MRIPLVCFGGALILGAACGGNSTQASAGVGGTASHASSTSSGTGGGACNSVAIQGGTNTTDATTAPPTMTGGALADGTWVMIAQTAYHDADAGTVGGGPPIAEVQVIMGSVLLDASSVNGGGPEGALNHANYGSLTTNGNHLTAKMTCGGVPDLDVTYTTDGMTLQELTPVSQFGIQWLTVFMKM
jgi:hypothetical protein